MIDYLIILAVHLYADFHLQGSHISAKKCDVPFMMILHCTLYASIMSIVYYFVFDRHSIAVFLILWLSHYLLDNYGCLFTKNHKEMSIWLDQAVHLAIALMLYWI